MVSKLYTPERVHGINDNDPFNYVICPICKRKFEIITSAHVYKYHNISMTEFKALYPNQPLKSEKYKTEFSIRKSESMINFCERLKNEPEKREKYIKNFRFGDGQKTREREEKRKFEPKTFKEYTSKTVDLNNTDTYVICPLCNKKFAKIIEYHLITIHGMSKDEFLKIFPNYSLESKKSIENRLESRRNFWRNLSDEEYASYVKQSTSNMGNKYLKTMLSDNKIYIFKAKWEIYVAEFFIKNGIDFEYEKEFIYHESGRRKAYLADFFLPKINLVLELKGKVWLEKFKENIALKKNSVLDSGHNFEMLMYNINKTYVINKLKQILNKYSINTK